MLKLAWYLITEVDYWATLPRHPRLDTAPELTAMLHDLFGDESPIDPARTGTAMEIIVRLAEYLTDVVPHGRAAVTDRRQFVRLLHGVNLLLSHLAQLAGRLAHQAHYGSGPDLSGLSDTDRETVSTALATATARLVEAAGLVKEAFLSTSQPSATASR